MITIGCDLKSAAKSVAPADCSRDHNGEGYFFTRCPCADKWAPVSSSNPDRNAQNIKLTESEKGP
jgi:hypothetical protein